VAANDGDDWRWWRRTMAMAAVKRAEGKRKAEGRRDEGKRRVEGARAAEGKRKVEGKRQQEKRLRHEAFLAHIQENPFLTDEEIAEALRVSVPTVRLDRMELAIPELRERLRTMAAQTHSRVKSLRAGDIIGQIVELELNRGGVSTLQTDASMAFENTKVVRGHFIYALAETLAIAVINEEAALVGVANIKYGAPVYAGSRLVARCEVRQVRKLEHRNYFVWVRVSVKDAEVFRGKFILVSVA